MTEAPKPYEGMNHPTKHRQSTSQKNRKLRMRLYITLKSTLPSYDLLSGKIPLERITKHKDRRHYF